MLHGCLILLGLLILSWVLVVGFLTIVWWFVTWLLGLYGI